MTSSSKNTDAVLRRVLYFTIALPVLVLIFNAYNSAIVKAPLFILAATLLLAGFVYRTLRAQAFTYQFSRVDIPILALIGLAICSLMYTASTVASLQTLLQLLCGIGLFFAARQLFDSRQSVKSLIAVIIGITVVVCVFGMIQFFFSRQLLFEFYLGDDRRVGSTLGNPAFLAGYIVLVTPLVISQMLNASSAKARYLHALLAATLGFLLIVTQSRSGIIALAVALALYAFMYARRLRTVVAVGISVLLVAAVVIVVFAPGLTHRFEAAFDQGPESTFARRVYFWQAGLKAIQASPVIGHGIGTYEQVMMQYRSPDYWTVRSEDIVPHAHNEIIEWGTELGIIGLALFGWVLWEVFRSGFNSMRNGKEWERIGALGFVCGLIGILIANLTDVSLRQTPIAAMTWLFMGLVTERLNGKSDPPRIIPVRFSTRLAWIPILVWIGFAVMYGHEQWRIIRSDSHTLAGLIATGAGKQDFAIAEYRKASELHSGSYLAMSNLALELVKANQPLESRRIIDQLLHEYPSYPKARLVRSVANLGLNSPGEALEDIRIELHYRTHPEAYYVESLIHQKLGDSTAERTALQNEITACRKGGIPLQLGYVCTRLRVLTPADSMLSLEKTFADLSGQFPGEPGIAENLALVRRRRPDSTDHGQQ